VGRLGGCFYDWRRKSIWPQCTNQPISDANLKKLLTELQQRGQVTITEGKVA
jgi:hypothetical protein